MRVWLTWENQTRNYGLAEAFDARLFVVDHNSHTWIIRTILSVVTTLFILVRTKPKYVFAQSPSLVLASLLALLKKIGLGNYVLILDLHNSSIEALDSTSSAENFLSNFSTRYADFTIVTNKNLCQRLSEFTGKTVVLPDRLPDIETQFPKAARNSDNEILLTVIASFADDEPIYEILTAIKNSKIKSLTRITGNKAKAGNLLKFESENIVFTDFLKTENYEKLLYQSDLIIDLTTRKDCLVCGAYEALSVGVPSLLSDTETNRALFQKSAVFTKNDSQSIEKAISDFVSSKDKLTLEAKQFRSEFKEGWQNIFFAAHEAIFAQ